MFADKKVDPVGVNAASPPVIDPEIVPLKVWADAEPASKNAATAVVANSLFKTIPYPLILRLHHAPVMSVDRDDLEHVVEVFQAEHGVELVERRHAAGDHGADGRRDVDVLAQAAVVEVA